MFIKWKPTQPRPQLSIPFVGTGGRRMSFERISIPQWNYSHRTEPKTTCAVVHGSQAKSGLWAVKKTAFKSVLKGEKVS